MDWAHNSDYTDDCAIGDHSGLADRWEARAYAYKVARIHSRLAWRDEMLKKEEGYTQPHRETEVQFPASLGGATIWEAGHIARRAPLSARGSGVVVSLALCQGSRVS
jgi:hypothetical protein